MSFETAMETYKASVNDALKDLNFMEESTGGLEDKLSQAMHYSLHAGGKRLRPILLLESSHVLKGNPHRAMPFACALELIHTYSLIHDDLPAMDNDDLRRGQPTNHKIYGEALAILAGDGLLNAAYELMLASITDMQSLEAAKILSKSAGSKGMIGGQAMDVLTEGIPVDLKTLEFIHGNKTARLIQAALEAGAVLAGGSESQVEIFSRFGYHLGMAFQIKDDVLDEEGNESLLGKPIGSDSKKGKNTYPSLCGIQHTRIMLHNHTENALRQLQGIEGDVRFLEELTRYLLVRNI